MNSQPWEPTVRDEFEDEPDEETDAENATMRRWMESIRAQLRGTK